MKLKILFTNLYSYRLGAPLLCMNIVFKVDKNCRYPHLGNLQFDSGVHFSEPASGDDPMTHCFAAGVLLWIGEISTSAMVLLHVQPQGLYFDPSFRNSFLIRSSIPVFPQLYGYDNTKGCILHISPLRISTNVPSFVPWVP